MSTYTYNYNPNYTYTHTYTYIHDIDFKEKIKKIIMKRLQYYGTFTNETINQLKIESEIIPYEFHKEYLYDQRLLKSLLILNNPFGVFEKYIIYYLTGYKYFEKKLYQIDYPFKSKLNLNKEINELLMNFAKYIKNKPYFIRIIEDNWILASNVNYSITFLDYIIYLFIINEIHIDYKTIQKENSNLNKYFENIISNILKNPTTINQLSSIQRFESKKSTNEIIWNEEIEIIIKLYSIINNKLLKGQRIYITKLQEFNTTIKENSNYKEFVFMEELPGNLQIKEQEDIYKNIYNYLDELLNGNRSYHEEEINGIYIKRDNLYIRKLERWVKEYSEEQNEFIKKQEENNIISEYELKNEILQKEIEKLQKELEKKPKEIRIYKDLPKHLLRKKETKIYKSSIPSSLPLKTFSQSPLSSQSQSQSQTSIYSYSPPQSQIQPINIFNLTEKEYDSYDSFDEIFMDEEELEKKEINNQLGEEDIPENIKQNMKLFIDLLSEEDEDEKKDDSNDENKK